MTTKTTTIPAKITTRWLRQQGTCFDQVKRFRATFGPTADLTRTTLIRAAEAGLDLDWLTERLPIPSPALAEYERVTAPAWAEFERVRAAAWAEYERVRAPAWAEFERVRAAALAEFNRVTAPALADALGLAHEPRAGGVEPAGIETGDIDF